jgi:hypothetical protein
MSLDIFGIVWIHIAAGIVLMRPRGLIIRFVPSGTEAVVFLLNDASYKILASLAD